MSPFSDSSEEDTTRHVMSSHTNSAFLAFSRTFASQEGCPKRNLRIKRLQLPQGILSTTLDFSLCIIAFANQALSERLEALVAEMWIIARDAAMPKLVEPYDSIASMAKKSG